MSIAINSNPERDQYQAAGGQTVFNFSFPIFSDTYIKVYQRGASDTPNDYDDILALGSDYTVTGVGEEAGGFITLIVPAVANDIITLVGEEPIDRESVFTDYNPFTVALNQQLNEQTVMAQQTFTYWDQVTPRYYFSTLVSDAVRPLKRFLPMLPDGHVWIGRGELGDDPDDISTVFFGSAGTGNVSASGPGMRPSIAHWTGVDFVITDAEVNISGAYFSPTAGTTADTAGFTDGWGAFHWPAHVTGTRPASPENGDTYYDSTLDGYYGYEDGAWVRFQTGDSSDDLIKRIITQVAHGLTVGQYVRITNPAGLFVPGLSTTAENAEIVGLVVDVQNANSFTLQTEGFVDAGVFAGLTPGGVYFLSDITPGAMSLSEPIVPSEVSLPVFIAETATTGILRPFRGVIIGGLPPIGGEGPPIVITVVQAAHGFTAGEVLRVLAADTYTLAQANNATNAVAVGFVKEVIDTNTFELQTAGFCDSFGAPFTPLVSASRYFLSPTTPGAITTTEPSSVGQYSVPMLVAANTTAGFILEQTPRLITSSGSGGGWVLLDTQTVSSDATVEFTTGIDGTYDAYVFVVTGLTVETDLVELWVQVSTDGGSTWRSTLGDYNYSFNNFGSGGGYSTSDTKIKLFSSLYAMGNDAGASYNGSIYMMSPSSNTLWKTFNHQGGYFDAVINLQDNNDGSGIFRDTTPIDGVRILASAGDLGVGTIRLYGIGQ